MASSYTSKSWVPLTSHATTLHEAGGHRNIRASDRTAPINTRAVQDSQRDAQAEKCFQRIVQVQGSEAGDAVQSEPGDLQDELKHDEARRRERARSRQIRLSPIARHQIDVLPGKREKPSATQRPKPRSQRIDAWFDRVLASRIRIPFYSDDEIEAAETLAGMRNTLSGARRPKDDQVFTFGGSAIPAVERDPEQNLPEPGPPIIDCCPGKDAGFHLESCVLGGSLVSQRTEDARRPNSRPRIRSSSCLSSPDLPALPGKMFPDLDELDV